jgi:hypothetical protein
MPIKNLTTVYQDITLGDITSISLQNRGGNEVEIFATNTNTAPVASEAGFMIGAMSSDTGSGKIMPSTMAELFPNVTTPTRLWARSADGQPARLWYNADAEAPED